MTFTLGHLAAHALERLAGTKAILAAAPAAVVFGTALEGVVVGWAHEKVLRQ